ncbi:type II toxin-antitoxin system RelE/ParE family toxin [Methylobacterium nodulans]|uniref:type II toxin-antitoxin system RelE/ParE family toxin n=1 Tax=Methylobacterium nodulans TaxID=114616 RepID=UPI001FCC6EE3|nr:type II toxin-antitoxin system RelE/ParE family toxin [Methylobacterium nodulans]
MGAERQGSEGIRRRRRGRGREDHDGDTYRCVYTIRLAHAVYVLHAFKKKSKRGSETPKPDMNLIRSRLREAEEQDRAAVLEPPGRPG